VLALSVLALMVLALMVLALMVLAPRTRGRPQRKTTAKLHLQAGCVAPSRNAKCSRLAAKLSSAKLPHRRGRWPGEGSLGGAQGVDLHGRIVRPLGWQVAGCLSGGVVHDIIEPRAGKRTWSQRLRLKGLVATPTLVAQNQHLPLPGFSIA
jgi:hypothetical protein